ncbi:MAG: hypothetical protein H6810_10035 [Phycisphaeraceae bacterium]|nr:MAG: hypothetical protein H6810_10035 [Phycisphaeraceae bacterium]
MTHLPRLAIVLLLLVVPALAAAQSKTPGAADTPLAAQPEFALRLAALSPDDPAAYLRLGEEVLALGKADEDAALARRLFGLAYELARRDADKPGVQASACIALADTARFERDRRWLWSIARLIDPRYSEPDWSRTVERDVSPESAFYAATTLGLLRSGEGVRARELLRDPGVRSVFTWYSGLLTGTGPGDVLTMLDREAQRWPCPECHNERIVHQMKDGQAVTVRCFTCRGNPGWPLSEAGFLATLRFESRVLAGVQRSWGAQLAADLGEPLRDPDPAAVVRSIGVDATKCVYSDGHWTTPE